MAVRSELIRHLSAEAEAVVVAASEVDMVAVVQVEDTRVVKEVGMVEGEDTVSSE